MNTKIIFRVSGLLFLILILGQVAFADGRFEATTAGVRFIVRDSAGQVIQNIKPEFDSATGNYVVKDDQKQVVAVRNCRALGKKDMIHNTALPKVDVDPETYEVYADGKLITCEPASVLPLAQRYFLF